MNKLPDQQHPLHPGWRVLLDACHAGIFLLDNELRIIWVNDYAHSLRQRTNYEGEVHIGSSIYQVLPPNRHADIHAIMERVRHGESVSYQVCYDCRDGSKLWMRNTCSAIRNEQGYITHICITGTDISELKQKEAALHESEQRWKFALEGVGNGVWEYNYRTGSAFYSSYYKKMLGFTDVEFDNIHEPFQSRLHPDDKEKVLQYKDEYSIGKRDGHRVEYRLLDKEGNYRWILDIGMLLERDETGGPLRVIGTIKDISHRKLAEQQLLESEQRFMTFMDYSPTMAWIMDENHVYHYMNEVYLKQFNLKESAVGKSMYDVFPKDFCDAFAKNNLMVWKEDRMMEMVEEAVGPNGEILKLQIFKFPLKQENGLRMLGGVGLNITEKLATEQALAEERERSKRALIQGIIDAQERERDELAYRLHENVNQVLTSAKLMLEVAAEKPEMSQEFVKKTLPYIGEAITELRNLSHGLRPATLNDISLEAAIVEAVQAANSKGRVRVAFNYKTTGGRGHVPGDVQLVLLRTVQEQLSNVLKFANAERAEVILQLDDDLVTLEIVDNGKGFDVEAKSRGVGLNNIINRVEFHKGSWTIDSKPGDGCLLKIQIPLSRI